MRSIHWPIHWFALLPLLALAGCDDLDPYRRTDVWRPTGANAGNLAAMVADKQDLIAGRGSPSGDGHGATMAIDRLWAGKPRPLSGSGSSGSGSGSGSGDSGGGSGGGGIGSGMGGSTGSGN